MSITYEYYKCQVCGELVNGDFLMESGEFESCCGSCVDLLNAGKTVEQIRKEKKEFEEYNTREAGLKEGRRVGAIEELEKLKFYILSEMEEQNDEDCLINIQQLVEYRKKRLLIRKLEAEGKQK